MNHSFAKLIMGGAFAVNGCASDSAATSGAPAAKDAVFGGSSGSSNGTTGTVQSVDAGLPPEKKAEGNYQSPVATDNVVWIANPTSGRVAYINVTSYSVQTVQAGDGPTYLAAVPGAGRDASFKTCCRMTRRFSSTRTTS